MFGSPYFTREFDFVQVVKLNELGFGAGSAVLLVLTNVPTSPWWQRSPGAKQGRLSQGPQQLVYCAASGLQRNSGQESSAPGRVAAT